nr:putative ribonuclease H-like domain-containing protein [Tanacetum cinerariifolium]
MEDALEDQLEDSIDERENDIHAENIHMENHVEPPVIQQEIEEGRPKRQRMQPRHFSEYQVKLPPFIDHTQPTSDQESSTEEVYMKIPQGFLAKDETRLDGHSIPPDEGDTAIFPKCDESDLVVVFGA